MTQRLLLGCLAALLAGVVLTWAHNQREPQWRIAQGMAGQHWYRLGLETAHIGYLASQTRPGSNGGWIFSSDLRFAMSESAPVQIEQTLSFGPSAPYPLLRADYSLQCDTTEHMVAKNLALVGILTYPVGISLLYILLMLRARRALLDEHPTKLSQALSFLVRVLIATLNSAP